MSVSGSSGVDECLNRAGNQPPPSLPRHPAVSSFVGSTHQLKERRDTTNGISQAVTSHTQQQ